MRYFGITGALAVLYFLAHAALGAGRSVQRRFSMQARHQLSLILISAVPLLGCVATPNIVSYKGQPVPAVSAVSMSCTSPYPLTQDCSAWSGATLRVKLKDRVVKIAGSADGKIVLVMSDQKALPTQYESEQAADFVQDVASSTGAKLVKLEALAIGGSVPGYILTFDMDVYSPLKRNSIGS
jgi:hypothetical protein